MKTSIFILEDNMTQVKTLTRYIHNYASSFALHPRKKKHLFF